MSNQETRNKRWGQIQREKKLRRKKKDKLKYKEAMKQINLADLYLKNETLDEKIQEAIDNLKI